MLAIGAHPDDIEIGAGGTLLGLAESRPGLDAHYVVLTGSAERQIEARDAAQASFSRGGIDSRAPRPARGPATCCLGARQGNP